MTEVLFIQGGGAGAHDEWDARMVADLRRRLGEGHEIRYPRMPAEGDPSVARWSTAIGGELASLADGAVTVGHSIGGTILVHTLAEVAPRQGLAAIILVSAPFVGQGGWPGGELELPGDLGSRLPDRVPVHIFQGLDDTTAPPDHAELYARAIPQATVHRLAGRDHQLNDDLAEVADVILRRG